jgi:5-methylcytosine-specific restriction protein A
MGKRPPVFRSHGPASAKQAEREADQRRGSARQRGYSAEWDREARAHLDGYPFCEYCAAGVFGPVRVSEAELVDHLVPHKGDLLIFWFRDWWVSCCTSCHSGPKQRLERQGRAALAALIRKLNRPTQVEKAT